METTLDMTHQETRTPMPPQIRAGSVVEAGKFSVFIGPWAGRRLSAAPEGS